MKTIKILTLNNGIITLDVSTITDAEKFAKELEYIYGTFIQL